MELPDQETVVTLHKGTIKGITNLSRYGDATLQAATDHILVSSSIEAKDIKAAYSWKKKRLK